MKNTSLRSTRDFLILILWGAFVLWMNFTKQLSTYLHPSLQIYTMIAGVMLIVLAIFSLRGLLKKSTSVAADHHSCCHDHESDHDDQDCCGHELGSQNTVGLLLKSIVLMLPLLVFLLGHNNHYTMSMIANRGVVQDLSNLPAANKAPVSTIPQSSNSTTPAKNEVDASSMPIQVIDLLYAVQMPTYREEFENKQVELIGQFVPLNVGNPKGDRFQAIRLFITCCAADAKPVGVTVQYDKPLHASEMSWIKITGIPTFPMEGGRRTAILMATKVEECPAPSEPFVY